MDLGCFHKYIAFYAYINCCKTNSSLKRGNETQIDFTENVIPKKWFMKPFVKTYLKKQQKQFVRKRQIKARIPS